MRALGLVLLLLAPAPDPAPEHVVIISIDGLRPEFYRGDYEAPTLREMAREGAQAVEVESVFPSSTYPAHASILTGVRPWKHGIVANTTWDAGGPTRDWYWYARDVRARTLWQAAREKGLKVAITYWPSSVGAEADWVLGEIWDPEGKETVRRLQAAATPGLLVELSMALGIPREKMAEDRAAIDTFVTGAAAYVFRRYKPNLQFVHLLQVDEVQHRDGREAPSVREAVRRQDANVGRILRAVRDSGLGDRTLVIVTGDHGFVDVDRQACPNALLKGAGMIETDGGRVTSWRALARSSGGSAAVYVKDPRDVPRVGEVLSWGAVADGRRRYAVLDRPALDRLGADPEAAFALDPEPGWAFSGAAASRLEEGVPTVKANHGQRPDRPGLQTGFVAAGAGVKRGAVVERMCLIDIAPTVARLLGLDLGPVEGSVLKAILE
jgi:predicted AlkP superfamily pyrophosphatase or phosphodiesterase